ncbi:MAG TPA: PrsW family glutamic-type intramembrane protease [Longilinea sp.]|nr:PrsW family glutamic-type intramembrane protease [Longilinea sp.]
MEQQRNERPGWVGQLLLGGFGSFIALALMLGLAANGFTFIARQPERALPLFQYAWLSGIILIALIPSIIYPVRRLLGKEVVYRPAPRLFKAATIGLLFWPGILIAGAIFADSSSAWLVMPFIQTAVIVLPIWWFVEYGRNKLEGGSRQRMWGVLGFNMAITPLLTICVEILVMGVLVIALGAVGGSRPDWAGVISQMSSLMNSGNFTEEGLAPFTSSILQLPGMVFIIMSLFAVAGPALEEALKPLGLWFVANRKPTPEQGWVMGLVSGAVFAFIESSTLVTNLASSGWTTVVLQRAGTGLLHVTTCGLVGMGLAYAWSERRYFRLILFYFCATAIHGLWNYLSIVVGLQPYLSTYNEFSIAGWNFLGTVSIVTLSLAMLTVLGMVNWKLRKQKTASVVPPPTEIFEETRSTADVAVEKEE